MYLYNITAGRVSLISGQEDESTTGHAALPGPVGGQLPSITGGRCGGVFVPIIMTTCLSSGQPNNAEGNENCLAIIVKGRPGFNDVACHHRKPVICQQ